MNASHYLGAWIKDHPNAAYAHRVLRYDRDTLVCFCGQILPKGKAIRPNGSVACCPLCASLWRKQQADKRRKSALLRLVTPPRSGAK